VINMEKVEDHWMVAVVKQGSYCRNCKRKATLSLHQFDIETGKKLKKKDNPEQKVELYQLCHICKNKIKNAKDIKTYRWPYERIVERDNRLDRKWQMQVYGGGHID